MFCILVFDEFPNGHFPTAGSTDSSLPLEKEEQVRLQARKWLEEQLKQYRVKRQQERVSPLSQTSSWKASCPRDSCWSHITLGPAIGFSELPWAQGPLQRLTLLLSCGSHLWGDSTGAWLVPPAWSCFFCNKHILFLNLPIEKQRKQTQVTSETLWVQFRTTTKM